MPRPPIDYAGTAWGNWEVLRREGKHLRMAAWLCRCTKCGHEQRVPSNRIRAREGVVCEKCESQPESLRTICTDEEFVRAWQTSASLAEVAAKLGGTRSQVGSIAGRLRKNRVPLKRLRSQRDYAALIELAASLLPKK